MSSDQRYFAVDGRDVPVIITRNARARRATLRVDKVRGEIRLSLPLRASLSIARRLVDDHRQWIAERLQGLPVPCPFVPGAAIPYDGAPVVIDWNKGHARAPMLVQGLLLVGGPVDRVEQRVSQWLRLQARNDLSARARQYAAKIGRPIAAIRIADATGRWGSCTTSARISFSWRLILAPSWVRDSVAAHEVAHLVHMDHSPAFHRLHGELLGADPRPARQWLAANGPALHWVGRPR